MVRVHITGMSGAGKSTLLAELQRRGHRTVDTDFSQWKTPDGLWDVPRMIALLDQHSDLIVSGTVENQRLIADRFDHILLLSAPLDVLLERLANRTSNTYGTTAEQRADVARYVVDVEPLLRRAATLELDGRLPVAELADVVEQLSATHHPDSGIAST